MKIVDVKLKDLKPYDNNPRHNVKAIKPVKESILKFGFKVPIVIDKNNVIVCGHTRFYASKEIGLETVPCIVADDLTQKQIDAFRLVDNRTAEFADWNFDKLAEELSELQDFNLSSFGFENLSNELENYESPEIQEKELAPFTKVHYLITLDVNDNDKVITIIEKLKAIKGVEIECTHN
jgi:ParB-like chromosome segregation protein Spo0J